MKTNKHIGSVDIKIDTSRIEGNLIEAQRLLTEQVLADCTPLVPFRQGALQSSASIGVNADEIMWNTPYAHYLYEGKVYGPNIPIYDKITGELTGFCSPPSKKPTGKQLEYHHLGATDHWFEEAKEQHIDDWIKLVKETVGGN